MKLVRANIQLEDVRLGQETRMEGKTLILEPGALRAFLMGRDERIKTLEISLARPGEPVRMICVKDVIAPWWKMGDFQSGAGRLQVLRNCAVVTCGRIVGFQEGIIDMSGPGALYSPFAGTINIVLEVEVVAGLSPHAHEEVLREAGLAAATFAGQPLRDVEADEILTWPSEADSSMFSHLPRVAYLYPLLSQGLLHDTYVLGENANAGLPRLISPAQLLDGAIISGNCVSACDKNTTYHHQHNPILHELCREHGQSLNFVGTVITHEPTRLAAKEAAAAGASELIRSLAPDGVIISKEGFGNPDTDQMMLIRTLEQAGIKTVALTDEYAGPDGCSQSLADVTAEADAMISVGNANERIVLPPMQRIYGPVKDLNKLAGACPQGLRQDGSLEIELQGIMGATNQLGFQPLRCREV